MQLLWALFAAFFRIGLFSFGGGYAMLPLIQREIVGIHRWLGLSEFIDVVAISQMTPGPIAINAATFVGFRVAGFWGSVVATTGVVLPSLIIAYAIARFTVRFERSSWLSGLMRGIRPVVVALITVAAVSMVGPSLPDWRSWAIALGVIIAGLTTGVNPILLILAAGFVGAVIY